MRSSPLASWEDKALFQSQFLGRPWQLARSWTMFMRTVVIEKLFNDALDSIRHARWRCCSLCRMRYRPGHEQSTEEYWMPSISVGCCPFNSQVAGIDIGCSIGIPVAIRLILFVSCRIARESRSIPSPRSQASTSAATSRSPLLVHHPVFTVLMACRGTRVDR